SSDLWRSPRPPGGSWPPRAGSWSPGSRASGATPRRARSSRLPRPVWAHASSSSTSKGETTRGSRAPGPPCRYKTTCRCSYVASMEVGIRELRADLSRYLKRVQAGEEIVITDRGKAVARIVRMSGRRKIDELIEQGLVLPARSRTGWLPEPIQPNGTVSDLIER